MVSIGPYSKGHDNLHMWDFVDYRPSHNPSICAVKNSLLGYVYNHPRLKKFGAVLKRANLNGQYEQPELDITMFIPYDEFLREPQSFYNNLDVTPVGGASLTGVGAESRCLVKRWIDRIGRSILTDRRSSVILHRCKKREMVSSRPLR